MKLLKHIALLLYMIGLGLIVKYIAYSSSVNYEFCNRIVDGNFCWFDFSPLFVLIILIVITIFCVLYLLEETSKATKIFTLLLCLFVSYLSGELWSSQGNKEFLDTLTHINQETITWETKVCEEEVIKKLKLSDTCYINGFSNAHYSKFNECRNLRNNDLSNCAKMVVIYSNSPNICEEVSNYIKKETCENMRDSLKEKILFCFQNRASTKFWEKAFHWPTPKYTTDCLKKINNYYEIEEIDNLAVAISCLFPENKTEDEISNCLQVKSKLKYTVTGQSQNYSIESHTTTIYPDAGLSISDISIDNRFRIIKRSPFLLEKNWE